MTDSAPVSMTVEDRVALVRFARPHRANPMDRATIEALLGAARRLAEQDGLNAVVLAGGEQNFTMGFDLGGMEPDGETDAQSLERTRRQGAEQDRALMDAWAGLAPVTIAAVEGWCVGGGAALACALDFRILGATATIYVPEIKRAMTVPGGTIPRLVALVGPARAKRIAVMAEKLAAERALDWGLADELAPEGKALDRAMAMAERAAALPPRQLRTVKAAVTRASATMMATADRDEDEFLEAIASEDHAEALRAFREKRPAKFTGR